MGPARWGAENDTEQGERARWVPVLGRLLVWRELPGVG